MDDPNSHVISTVDGGDSWRYFCLGDSNHFLATDNDGRLLALNEGYFLVSHDYGSSWRRQEFVVDWPERTDLRRVAFLRHVTFTDDGIGYALVVHWPKRFAHGVLPDVGLVMSTDSGLHWRHKAVFQGPDMGDINESHMMALRISN